MANQVSPLNKIRFRSKNILYTVFLIQTAPSLDLRAGSVPIIEQRICKKNDIYGEAIMDGMFCAGNLDNHLASGQGVDACDGDSGGPFVCQDNGRFRY